MLAVLGKLDEIHVRCINSDVVEKGASDWQAKVTDQLGGVEKAMWSADSRQILIWAGNNLRISIWSLVT